MKQLKLKWQYDKENNEWFVNESYPYEKDGCIIRRTGNKKSPDYTLTFDNLTFSYHFKKLSSAKMVVELIKNG